MGRFIIPDSEHGNIIEEADTKESEEVYDTGDACDYDAAGNDMKIRKKSIKSRRKINICGGNDFMRKEVVSMQDRAKGGAFGRPDSQDNTVSNTVMEADMEGVETVGESGKGNDASEVENDEPVCAKKLNTKYNTKERKEHEEKSQPSVRYEIEEDTNYYQKYVKRQDSNKKDIRVGHRLWRWQIEINI